MTGGNPLAGLMTVGGDRAGSVSFRASDGFGGRRAADVASSIIAAGGISG